MSSIKLFAINYIYALGIICKNNLCINNVYITYLINLLILNYFFIFKYAKILKNITIYFYTFFVFFLKNML